MEGRNAVGRVVAMSRCLALELLASLAHACVEEGISEKQSLGVGGSGRPAPADAFAGESLEATLASGRGRSRRRPGSNETRPQPAPSPVRHSHELSEDGPGLAHRPAASYDWGGGLADVLRPVGPAPRRLAPTEPLPPRRRAPASPVESSDAAWGGGLADVLRPVGSAPRRLAPTEPRRRAPASPVEVVDTWGGGLADVLPARGRAQVQPRFYAARASRYNLILIKYS